MKQITVRGENIINVPNFISLYRLLAFPVIFFMALTGREQWFVILLCISLVSDVLDGNIARLFKLQTHFGAALDNLADIFTYAMAILGLFIFKWTDIKPHSWILFLFLGIFILSRFCRICPKYILFCVIRLGLLPLDVVRCCYVGNNCLHRKNIHSF